MNTPKSPIRHYIDNSPIKPEELVKRTLYGAMLVANLFKRNIEPSQEALDYAEEIDRSLERFTSTSRPLKDVIYLLGTLLSKVHTISGALKCANEVVKKTSNPES